MPEPKFAVGEKVLYSPDVTQDRQSGKVRKCQPRGGANVDAIDLCCSDGLFTTEMAKVASRVVAIDIDRWSKLTHDRAVLMA